MESSFWLVDSLHFRDSPTASKALIFVSINQLHGINDTNGLVSKQQVHRVETRLALDINQMPEIPTHEVIDFRHGAGSYMSCIIGVFWGKNRLFDVLGGELFDLLRNRHKIMGIECLLKKLANT